MPKIVVDRKLVEEITLDELIAIQDGDLKALRSILGKFVQGDDGVYLPQKEGVAYVGGIKVGQLKEISAGIVAELKAVVPNE